MRIIIVSNKSWHKRYVDELAARTGCDIFYISDKTEVNYERFKILKPDWVFFTHWSFIIPASIYDKFPCVVFHMTDLPFGRGGSPLQNLISRGIYETKLTALHCCREVDAGDIYLKRNLSLWGSAEEIYLRAAELTKEMIIEIVNERIQPIPQNGEVTVFKRRKPEEGNIEKLTELNKVFDYIRMLDADTYPAAFLDIERLHIEFSRASLRDEFILADARIFIRKNEKACCDEKGNVYGKEDSSGSSPSR